jgi:hypothetical protein
MPRALRVVGEHLLAAPVPRELDRQRAGIGDRARLALALLPARRRHRDRALDPELAQLIVAKHKGGRPHRPTEGVVGSLVVVGDDALAVAQDPPATLLVDTRARTISRPRPLPTCR